MKSYRVKDVEAVRYFLKNAGCKTQEQYERLTEIVAECGALIISEEMLMEYLQLDKEE